MSDFVQDRKQANARAATIMAIEIDGEAFYLPQVDLITFENTQQLLASEKQDLSVASINIGAQTIPVYCLSKDFDLLNYIPDERKVCIISGCKDQRFGFLCDKIQKLSYSEIKFEPVPDCMRTANTPLSSLFLFRPESGGADLGMMLRNDSILHFLKKSQQDKVA